MCEISLTEVPQLYAKARTLQYPFDRTSARANWSKDEIEATVIFGDREIYVLAPRTKIDGERHTLEVSVVGEVGDFFLVSLPGVVQNAGSTIKVRKSEFNGGQS